MPGIPREVAEHSLEILPHSEPCNNGCGASTKEWRQAIGVELRKLLDAEFIKEVFHPRWLANLVLVDKRMGSGGCV
jgi:hypothetical protein